MVYRAAVPDIHFRHLGTADEFRQAEEVQIAAWGMVEEHPVPSALQRAMEDNGGLLLGAFDEHRLAGFCLGFLGREGENQFHYSHMTAVRPEYQSHRLGFRLKCYQREEALKQALAEVRWTFDPLQSKNAFLNLRRLGARPTAYLVNYYGRMDSEVNRGLATDRLRVSWELESAHVLERISGRYPSSEQDRVSWNASQSLVDTDLDRAGVRIPMTVSEPSRPNLTIEIPWDLNTVRARGPDAVRAWREATRAAFRTSLDAGYRVDDLAVLTVREEERSFYFLSLGGATTTLPGIPHP